MKSLKALKKAAGIFAAMALVFGAVSCSSDDDDDDDSAKQEQSGGDSGSLTSLKGTYWVQDSETEDNVTVAGESYIYFTSDTAGEYYSANDEKLETAKDGSESTTVAYDAPETFTYTYTDSKATFTLGGSSGTATVSGTSLTLTFTDADEGTKYTKASAAPAECTVTVTVPLNYTFNFSDLSSLSDGSATTKVAAMTEEATYGTGVLLYSKGDGNLRIRLTTNTDSTKTYSVNYNGSGLTDTSLAVGDTLSASSNVDRYMGIDVSKFETSGNVTVSFGIKAVKSKDAIDDIGIAAIVDSSNKVLAVETGLKLKSGDDERTISATVAKDANVKLVFSRGGAGAGGMDATSLTAVAAE